MEALKRARRPVRVEFEKLFESLQQLLMEEVFSADTIAVKYKVFGDTFENLQMHDNRVLEQCMIENISNEDEDAEYDEIRKYKEKYEHIRHLKDKKLLPTLIKFDSAVNGGSLVETRLRTLNLPTVKIRKFTGKLMDWLGFWAQFQKIDEDEHLHGSDKFWHLLQAVEPNTDASEIISGYAQSNENYPKVVAALKRHYGNTDVLLQVYLRELLELVISNVKSKEKIPLKSLFLKLDSHLRSLKTLNLEKADPATWLFPLVESCLPENLLYNWQRSPLANHDGSKDDPPQTRLDLLMSFMEKEVAINQRIELTRNFNLERKPEPTSTKSDAKDRGERDRERLKRKSAPTLSSFHTGDIKLCAFCDNKGHATEECYKAKRMSYDEKMKILAVKGLCYRCCREKHYGRTCRASVKCLKCGLRHQTVICQDKTLEERVEKPAKRSKPNDVNQVSSLANFQNTHEVALQTILVKLKNGQKECVVRAFIDSGSQRSYVLKSTVAKLRLLPIGSEKVVHCLFGERQTSEVVHQIYDLKVTDLQGSFETQMEVRDQTRICGTLPKINIFYGSMINELNEENIVINELTSRNMKVEMLIGADCYASIIGERVKRLRSGAVAIQTKLGWTILGKISSDAHYNENNYCVDMHVRDACLTSLWELDTLGIRDPAEKLTAQEKERLQVTNFKKNITRLKDGRYSVKFPWKIIGTVLPENREVAIKRLQSTTQKLRSAGLVETYGQLFKDWEKEGFIQQVKNENERKLGQRVHYIPHRAVVKPESLTTPVRPVFDASCRIGKNPSLNDMLYKGENLLLQIPQILLGFRRHSVGFVSDIRKAFQMIDVAEEDRDLLRFFWWKSSDKMLVYRHSRVPFGANCSPFMLLAVIEFHLDHLPKEDLQIGKKLKECYYVDNCVGSVSSAEEYRKFRKNAIRVMSEAKMDLRMWFSSTEDFDDPKTFVVPVLGLLWNRKSDELFINNKKEKVPEKVTKRVILSMVQKLFDPMGFICPAVLHMKLLLQRAWQQKLKWDDQVSNEDVGLFLNWQDELAQLDKIKLPRVATSGEDDVTCWWLHTFTDASKSAYAASVFLRTECNNRVSVQLLIAKTRVAPIKELSIPRLELMGCLLGARLSVFVKKAMKIEDVKETLWTDSKTAEAWIKRQNQWEVFVANRVKEIVSFTKVDNWRHIPGKSNPANLPSRGCSPKKLAELEWHKGPCWLYDDPSTWPTSNDEVDEEKISASIRKVYAVPTLSFGIITAVQNNHSYWGYVRIVGWVRRFLFNRFRHNEPAKTGKLSAEEISRAEKVLLKSIQREVFTTDKSTLAGLDLFEDEWGLLRVKTRLSYRSDSLGFKFPILLPNNRIEIRRLIMDTHVQYCHAGAGFLFCILRRRFWVLRTRRTIKDVISKCVTCRKFAARPRPTPPAPLPLDRIKDAEVFEVVGVDLAGPLLLKSGKKVWFVIFTCAIYRAVHFELVNSLSTQTFIAALGKFIRKFRRPKIIYSDNGSNFRGSDNFFKSLDWNAIQKDRSITQITWKWLPVASPWWGGWWERLIGVAKGLLKRTVGKGSLNRKELEAVMDAVAETMNNRPLTHLNETSDDLETLTPNHFLHPFGCVHFPEQEMSEASKMRYRIEYVATLRKELQGRFVREYLGLLVNKRASPKQRELTPGELVLIGSDNRKRIIWPLARVIELIPGGDGACRVVKVKTQNGESIQSVRRLYPLEMDTTDEWNQQIQQNASEKVRRSKRVIKAPQRFGFLNII